VAHFSDEFKVTNFACLAPPSFPSRGPTQLAVPTVTTAPNGRRGTRGPTAGTAPGSCACTPRLASCCTGNIILKHQPGKPAQGRRRRLTTGGREIERRRFQLGWQPHPIAQLLVRAEICRTSQLLEGSSPCLEPGPPCFWGINKLQSPCHSLSGQGVSFRGVASSNPFSATLVPPPHPFLMAAAAILSAPHPPLTTRRSRAPPPSPTALTRPGPLPLLGHGRRHTPWVYRRPRPASGHTGTVRSPVHSQAHAQGHTQGPGQAQGPTELPGAFVGRGAMQAGERNHESRGGPGEGAVSDGTPGIPGWQGRGMKPRAEGAVGASSSPPLAPRPQGRGRLGHRWSLAQATPCGQKSLRQLAVMLQLASSGVLKPSRAELLSGAARRLLAVRGCASVRAFGEDQRWQGVPGADGQWPLLPPLRQLGRGGGGGGGAATEVSACFLRNPLPLPGSSLFCTECIQTCSKKQPPDCKIQKPPPHHSLSSCPSLPSFSSPVSLFPSFAFLASLAGPLIVHARWPQKPAVDLRRLAQQFWRVGAPFWTTSEGRVGARWKLAGVLALTVGTTAVSVVFNFLGRDFFNALESEHANSCPPFGDDTPHRWSSYRGAHKSRGTRRKSQGTVISQGLLQRPGQ